MANIQNNQPVITDVNNQNSKNSKTSNAKIDGNFGTPKVKVSIFKKVLNYIIRKLHLSSKQKTDKKLSERIITNTQAKKPAYVNTPVDMRSKNIPEKPPRLQNDSEGAFEYWDANIAEESQRNARDEFFEERIGLTKTSYTNKEPIYENISKDEPIYENIPKEINNSDTDYVNLAEIRELQSSISLDSLSTINKDMKLLESHLDKIESSAFEEPSLSTETFTKFNEINANSTNFKLQPDKIFNADNKYNDIPCPKHSSATKGNIYHANNINFEYGGYVAAQGPYTGSPSKSAANRGARANTAENFIALLAEKESAVSVSLVKDTEFGRTANNQLPPTEIGETLEIAEIKSQGKIIREKTTIKKLDSIYHSGMKLQTDVFSINGKTHIRVYDLDWEDKTGGNSARLSAISVFVEKLRRLPELEDRKDKPVTVNCNAGVGRTGTFILINNMTRRYLEGSGTHDTQDIIKDMKGARENRPAMVQKAQQLETIKTVSKNVEDFFDPIAEKLNIACESRLDR